MIKKHEILNKKNKDKIKDYLIEKILYFFKFNTDEQELSILLPNVNLFLDNGKINEIEIKKKLKELLIEDIYQRIFFINPYKLLQDNIATFYFLPDEIILNLLKRDEEIYYYALSLNESLSSSFIKEILMNSNDDFTYSNLANLPNVSDETINLLKKMNNDKVNSGLADSGNLSEEEIKKMLFNKNTEQIVKEKLLRNKNITIKLLKEYEKKLNYEKNIIENRIKILENKEETIETLFEINNLGYDIEDISFQENILEKSLEVLIIEKEELIKILLNRKEIILNKINFELDLNEDFSFL